MFELLGKMADGGKLRPNGKGGYALDGKDVDRGHAWAILARKWATYRAGVFEVSGDGHKALQGQSGRKAA